MALSWWEKSRIHQLRQGSSASGVQTVTENPGVTVDNTDPANPVVGANISTDTPNLIGLGTDDGLFAEDAPSDGTTYGRKDGEWVESGGGALLSAREIRKDFHGVSAGDELYAYISSPMTISGVSVIADASGDLVVDIRKVTIGDFPADSGDSICASAKPTLSSAQTYVDTTLTGWDKTAAIGDTYTFYVDSATTVTDFEITLFGKAEYGELAVSGAFTDTDIGDQLNGSPLAISGGLAPYSLSGSPYSGTRPAGVSIAVSGTDLVATGATTTEASYSWTERVLSSDAQHYDVVCSVDVIGVNYGLWNPSDMGGEIALSNGNSRATSTTVTQNFSSVRATQRVSGKTYFEYVLFNNSAVSGDIVGAGTMLITSNITNGGASPVGTAASTTGVWSPSGVIYENNISKGTATGITTTQSIGFAVDPTTRSVWVKRIGAAGWVGGGDPAAGTTPTVVVPGDTPFYPACSPFKPSCYVDIVANPANFSGSAPSGFGALTDVPFDFGAHEYWRVRITAAQSGSYITLAEVSMSTLEGGANLCSGGTALADSSYSGSYLPAKAFDGSAATYWISASGLPHWIGYQFASPVSVGAFKLQAAPASYGVTNESPKDFTLEYSDDGSTWTKACTYSAVSVGWGYGVIKEFVV